MLLTTHKNREYIVCDKMIKIHEYQDENLLISTSFSSISSSTFAFASKSPKGGEYRLKGINF